MGTYSNKIKSDGPVLFGRGGGGNRIGKLYTKSDYLFHYLLGDVVLPREYKRFRSIGMRLISRLFICSKMYFYKNLLVA